MRDSAGSMSRRQPGSETRHEPSLTGSLEQLLASSQAVVTKRIDLALLEGQELVSRSLTNAALLGVAVFLGAVAWIAGGWALIQFLLPLDRYGPINQFGAFAALNAIGAIVCVLMARRQFATPIASRTSNHRHEHTTTHERGGH